MGVKCVIKENMLPVYSVYTESMYFEIENETIVKAEPHILGGVPIFEYPANTAGLGAFEIALPLLDAINEVESDRLDDVVQFVNSFLALLGSSIDGETAQLCLGYRQCGHHAQWPGERLPAKQGLVGRTGEESSGDDGQCQCAGLSAVSCWDISEARES